MYSDCSGVTLAISPIYLLSFIRHGDSVVLVNLTAAFLKFFGNIDCEMGKLAVSVNFSNGVTVPVFYHSEGWSTKAVIVFVVLSCTFRVVSAMLDCGFQLILVAALLTCIAKYGNGMRPCLLSKTIMHYAVQSVNRPCQILHHDDTFSKSNIFTTKFKCDCC